MEKSEYINLSSADLKTLINKKKKEIRMMESYLIDVTRKEHDEKYISVKVEGCKGCGLEHTISPHCDHCDGFHYEDRERV